MKHPTIDWQPETDKVLCDECEAKLRTSGMVRVPNPSGGRELAACPKCRTPEHLVWACYFPGCWEQIECGTPTTTVYVHTCGEHRPRE